MKGTEKSQTYEALLKLIEGHLSAHQMAKWNDVRVIERLSELLIKRIYRVFDVKFKEEPTTADEFNKEYLNGLYGLGEKEEDHVANPYGDDDYAVPVE